MNRKMRRAKARQAEGSAAPDNYTKLALALQAQGRFDEAEQALRRVIALQPQSAAAFVNLGNFLWQQGRPAEAEAVCRRAIALDGNLAVAYCNLGNAQASQDRLVHAAFAYRQAIAIKPDLADAHSNLSVVLKQLGHIADAEAAIEQALRLAPHNTFYLLQLSDIRHFRPDDPYLAGMESLVGVGAVSAKEQIELHFALAKAYQDTGRRDDSWTHLLAGNALKRRHITFDESATAAEFERVKAVFTPDLVQALHGAGEPSSLPIFVIGMPRSGTTLIAHILASHPRVFGAGELLTLGESVAALAPAKPDKRGYPETMLTLSQPELSEFGARYVAEIGRLAPTATHIVDKMPSNFLYAGLIHLALPQATIIHVVRDAADTCLSCFSKLFTSGQFYTYDLAELGRYYRRYQDLMQHWQRVLPPGRILDVHYEDLVGDLEGQVRRIIAHCGLDWDQRCMAFYETDRPVRTASATQVRRPIYRSAIGRAQASADFLKPLLTELYGRQTWTPLVPAKAGTQAGFPLSRE